MCLRTRDRNNQTWWLPKWLKIEQRVNSLIYFQLLNLQVILLWGDGVKMHLVHISIKPKKIYDTAAYQYVLTIEFRTASIFISSLEVIY